MDGVGTPPCGRTFLPRASRVRVRDVVGGARTIRWKRWTSRLGACRILELDVRRSRDACARGRRLVDGCSSTPRTRAVSTSAVDKVEPSLVQRNVHLWSVLRIRKALESCCWKSRKRKRVLRMPTDGFVEGSRVDADALDDAQTQREDPPCARSPPHPCEAGDARACTERFHCSRGRSLEWHRQAWKVQDGSLRDTFAWCRSWAMDGACFAP